MDGDVEFVNTFMSKMKDKLHDHLGQVMMLETHNELAMKRLETVSEELENVKKDLEAKDTAHGLAMGKISTLETKIDNLESDKSDLNKQLETYKTLAQNAVDELNRVREEIMRKNNEENTSYVSQINTLQSELDNCKRMEQTLIKDFKNLQKKYDEAIAPVPTPTPVKKTNK